MSSFLLGVALTTAFVFLAGWNLALRTQLGAERARSADLIGTGLQVQREAGRINAELGHAKQTLATVLAQHGAELQRQVIAVLSDQQFASLVSMLQQTIAAVQKTDPNQLD